MTNASESILLLVIVAMSTSMALIPLMIRLAPALGMMDKPDPRKIHLAPIPRVGGVGIVVGALIPLLIWLPWNDLTLSYFLGSLVLLVFGLWDDARELGHYVKFAGQFVAALLVVYYGGLHVSVLPFGGMEPIGETWGQFFTVFAIVGMINAINHSDGLDGLGALGGNDHAPGEYLDLDALPAKFRDDALPGADDAVDLVTIQSDGKIVVLGQGAEDFVVARYLENGTLDAGFGQDGIATVDFGDPSDVATSVTVETGMRNTARSINSVSVAPQIPGRRILALTTMARALSGAAAAWT